MEIRKVAVIGGGLMGRQIALNSAIHGVEAVVYDLSGEVCQAVSVWAEEYLEGRIKKGRMTENAVAQAKAIFHVETELEKAVCDADLVIEAIVEIEEVKINLFKQLAQLVKDETIICTNSSYMLSSSFRNYVKNPENLLNMHYYNPALAMKLVEIMQGEHTSEAAVDACYEFCIKTGKKPIRIRKELEGYVGSRISKLVGREARWMVENEYLTPQEVDTALENGLNYPMGPFRLNDLTGVDLVFHTMQSEYEKTGIKPDMYDTYEQMVKEGRVGRKSGHGFYDYE